MEILLDTHILLWFFSGDLRLSELAKITIEDVANKKYISIVSAWEMTIKQSKGNLTLEMPSTAYIREKLELGDFYLLSMEMRHLEILARLPLHHKDPFDRILIAQAIAQNLVLVSADQVFHNYPTNLMR
jgi:PIN domain nuclease of toxin-antitoxin system